MNLLASRTVSGEARSGTVLSWFNSDIEQRLGFRGGRYTRTNGWLAALVAVLLSMAFFGLMTQLPPNPVVAMFLERGFTPYVMVFLAFWSLVILFLKLRKLAFQRRAFRLEFLPQDPQFVLSAMTVEPVLAGMRSVVDDPRHFVLLNRIQIALSNLRNIGRIGDVDDILHSQAELDQSGMETSYSLVRGFVWAIPVLGFIGTVMGLSVAIGGFGEVLNRSAETAELASSLKVVTAGLATAFETTLLALLLALGLQIFVTFLHKAEEEFLDDCTEFCQRRIVGRLRMMPFDGEEQP